MVKKIALFNHKGGVSKTTTTFHIGWMLAEKGKKVLLVDADPQCNLSGLILGLRGESEFENFYENQETSNIRAGLLPAFESKPEAIKPVECLEVKGREGLYLLPGHIRLTEYEVTLGIAQELSGSIQTLQNLPGSISYLLDVTAEKYEVDYVLLDMNPSLSSINQNLLMTSDYFIIPTAPDYFSDMAIQSLVTVIPRWFKWSERAQQNELLASAAYPYPAKLPKLLGTIIQKFRPRNGTPTVGFQKWINSINVRVEMQLVPALKELGMTLPEERYREVDQFFPNHCLGQISDFNTLIAVSQDNKTPVFALTDSMFGHVGTILDNDKRKREEFRDTFDELANKIISLTN